MTTKYFLVTIYTCENAIFHEGILQPRNGYVSKDDVMSMLENNIPQEVMPLFYMTEETKHNGMIRKYELERFNQEQEEARKEELARRERDRERREKEREEKRAERRAAYRR